MSSHLDRAVSALFPLEGSAVGNVKFFRGLNREVTAEQLAEQLLVANEQINQGMAERIGNIDGDLAA